MEADPNEDILGPKKRNYEFLQFVREKKYAEALFLGKQILKESPDNPSVRKFVEFIEKNAKKRKNIFKVVDDMVKEEEQYESVHSSDDSESEEEAQGEEKEKIDEKSSSEKDSKQDQEEQEEQEEQKPEKKIELTTCTLNSIPHVCPRHHKLIIQAAAQGKV